MQSRIWNFFRSRKNIYNAWLHVRKSASQSKNSRIRDAALDFEARLPANLDRITKSLRKGIYRYPKAIGVIKDKAVRERQGKPGRPIVVAAIEARVVQRAVLLSLQQKSAELGKYSIGKIRAINESKVGIGGLPKPYGGVDRAVEAIRNDIRLGATHYWRSDIVSFFSKIPKSKVIEFLSHEVQCPTFVSFFQQSLEVELENSANLTDDDLGLFPKEFTGVPQGSSLSSLAGNILLHSIDNEFEKQDCLYLRYVDDVLILSKSQNRSKKLSSKIRDRLGSLNLEIHRDSKKTSFGEISNGFEFVGYRFDSNSHQPAPESFLKLQHKIQKICQKSLTALQSNGFLDKQEEHFGRVIHRVNNTIESWSKSYSISNHDNDDLLETEDYLRDNIQKYISAYFGKSHKLADQTLYFGRPSVPKYIRRA